MNLLTWSLTVFAVALSSPLTAAPPPAEIYASPPSLTLMEVSPDGKTLAFIGRSRAGQGLYLYNIETDSSVAAANVEKIKPTSLEFAGNDHVIIVASEPVQYRRASYDYTRAFSYSIRNRRISKLQNTDQPLQTVNNPEQICSPQMRLGRMVGKAKNKKEVYMPAYVCNSGAGPRLALHRVDLDDGDARVIIDGRVDTSDWLVDPDSNAFAREDFVRQGNRYSIHRYDGKESREVFSQSGKPPLGLLGIHATSRRLIVWDQDYNGAGTLYSLEGDHELTDLGLVRADSAIMDFIVDINRVVMGFEYAGQFPDYVFLNKALQLGYEQFKQLFEGSAVWLKSWSADFSRLLFRFYDGHGSANYAVYDVGEEKVLKVFAQRDNIPPGVLGEIMTIEYKSRDGLAIPAILTWPAGVQDRQDLPMVVIAQGVDQTGQFDFNWMAQFFASRGYVVLLPSVRGTRTFGLDFQRAGYGEWAGKMQDDIADGVGAMARMGAADPSRVCIVGSGLGGYMALASGVFHNDLFRCVAAIAPMTDVNRFVDDLERKYYDWVMDYWYQQFGADKAQWREISPVNQSQLYQAPVLLIHGTDDSAFPIRHSQKMLSALRKADKKVELLKLKGAGHKLTPEERRNTLEALESFIGRHMTDK